MAYSFKRQLGIASGPHALFGSSFHNRSYTRCSDTSRNSGEASKGSGTKGLANRYSCKGSRSALLSDFARQVIQIGCADVIT